MKIRFLAAFILATLIFAGCDDTTDTIGSSLTGDEDKVLIKTDSFYVATRTIVADSVLSRSVIGSLGKVKDPETGAYLTANYMTQFGTLADYKMPAIEQILSLQDGRVVADSCDIRLFFDKYYGDTLSIMKMTAGEMAMPMKEGINYYSNFNPAQEGFIRKGGLTKNKSYTLRNMSNDRYIANSKYYPDIRIFLNEPYTDVNGITYNNYGTYVMRKYYENPGNFKNSFAFINNVCPGFYFEMKDGLGSLAYIRNCELNVYFTYKDAKKDTVLTGTSTFAGTEEVLQTTFLKNDKKAIQQMANDNTCTYIKSPAGMFTELTLPVEDIFRGHENDTINSAQVVMKRLNDNTSSKYNFGTPEKVLMVRADSMYTFFEKNQIANNVTSYIANYGPKENGYLYGNISGLVVEMYRVMKNGMASDTSWKEKHPNWNKVVLIPVTTTSVMIDGEEVLTRVMNDMRLRGTRLIGGSGSKNGDVKISVIYSKFRK